MLVLGKGVVMAGHSSTAVARLGAGLGGGFRRIVDADGGGGGHGHYLVTPVGPCVWTRV